MMTNYESENYLRGCIKSCQEKGHIQQVCFSTYHNAITQVCFTCEAVRTSISKEEVKGSRKAKPLNYFKELKK
jgi:hypothetical protein